jgi:hypothetical protein
MPYSREITELSLVLGCFIAFVKNRCESLQRNDIGRRKKMKTYFYIGVANSGTRVQQHRRAEYNLECQVTLQALFRRYNSFHKIIFYIELEALTLLVTMSTVFWDITKLTACFTLVSCLGILFNPLQKKKKQMTSNGLHGVVSHSIGLVTKVTNIVFYKC